MIQAAHPTPAREYFPGMGDAVADRTINRKVERLYDYTQTASFTLPRRDDMALDDEVAAYCKSNGLIITGYDVEYGDDLVVKGTLHIIGYEDKEKWEDVAHRVALGSVSLHPEGAKSEFGAMHHHLRQASILMSGRHLQHGDENQAGRPMEVFTNCSSSAASFLTFYLLLNGSGVGRAYNDEMMSVDYRNMPIVVPVIDQMHKDVQSGEINMMDARTAEKLYSNRARIVFMVPDSREGWAKALEQIDKLTFAGTHRDDVLILDFSEVRPKGSPIKGMQNRPSSGPGPLMVAITNMAKLRDAGMEPWMSAMFADHYLSECVLVGGARRAARMACKTWRDKSVLDFIEIKKGGFLWSANNSVLVDQEFWDYVNADDLTGLSVEEIELGHHAKRVFEAVCHHSYFDGTGEPGLINQDKLTRNDEGVEELFDGDFAKSAFYEVDPGTKLLMGDLARRFASARENMIVNPCGEIPLSMLGGYCVIADVVPFHAAMHVRGPLGADAVHVMQRWQLNEWDADAEDAFRVATRALIRTNLMDSLYKQEVARTNRIGVGMTGIHEYAASRFGYGFRDLIDEEKSLDFWLMLSRFKRAVQDEAEKYAAVLGVAVPHTNTTIKPAGTTSKLFGLTEGAHLPPMREYLRWVQFRNDDPLVDEYREKGYPVRKLQTYSGTTIVGFPTKPLIVDLFDSLGMGDKLVTAGEATPEEQYQYLRLLEKYWLRGVEEDGVTPLEERGGQVSYTLKYDPKKVSYEEFKRTMREGQASVRCCSVMPQVDMTAFEYQPEQPVSKHEYEQIAQALQRANMKEDVGLEHVDCASGACPVSFNENSAAA